MNIKLICEIVNGKLNNKIYEDRIIDNFKIDSRLIENKDCFITINSGYKYIKSVRKKVGLIITDQDIKYNIPIIKVDDPIKALGLLGKYKRSIFKGKIIGITGSTGKTTTKELIYDILKTKYKVLKSDKNNNNHIGLPLTLCNIKDCDFVILEMGMNHLGEIEYLSNICKPDIGIITNIGTSHIGNLGSKKNIYKAKMEILKGMDNNNLIVNGDSKYLKKTKYFKCGINKKNNLKAYNIISNLNELKFNISIDKEYEIIFNNIGKHFITDILLAIKIGLIYDIDIKDIIESIKNYKCLEHRMNIYNYKNNILIDDTYNSCYESLISVLDLIKDINKNKLLIIGSILELGKYSKKIHKKIVKKLKKIKNSKIILVGEEFNKYKHFNNVDEVISYLKDYNFNNELILLKGSRRINLDKIENYIKNINFS